MTIEIRELVIRATVVDDKPADSRQFDAALARLKAQLLAECLGRIDDRLRDINER